MDFLKAIYQNPYFWFGCVLAIAFTVIFTWLNFLGIVVIIQFICGWLMMKNKSRW